MKIPGHVPTKILKILLVILFFFIFILLNSQVFAASAEKSNYVLPYPGMMPGNKLYRIYEIYDLLRKYYSFGDFSQFKYNLSMADKYLVEAKTLFEYKQYLLGYKALKNSDSYFKKVKPTLDSAHYHGKEVTDKSTLLKQAANKHTEELSKMRRDLPESFEWKPEKSTSTGLELWKAIDSSIKIRQSSQ